MSPRPHIQTLPNFLCMLPTYGRGSVLWWRCSTLVLWMTLYFPMTLKLTHEGATLDGRHEFDVYDCHAFTLQKATQCTQKHISSFLYVLSKHSNDLVKLLQCVSLSAFLGLTVLYWTFLLICLSLRVCVWAMLPDSFK